MYNSKLNLICIENAYAIFHVDFGVIPWTCSIQEECAWENIVKFFSTYAYPFYYNNSKDDLIEKGFKVVKVQIQYNNKEYAPAAKR